MGDLRRGVNQVNNGARHRYSSQAVASAGLPNTPSCDGSPVEYRIPDSNRCYRRERAASWAPRRMRPACRGGRSNAPSHSHPQRDESSKASRSDQAVVSASTSISTTNAGAIRAEIPTIVDAGRISAKYSLWARPTASWLAVHVDDVHARPHHVGERASHRFEGQSDAFERRHRLSVGARWRRAVRSHPECPGDVDVLSHTYGPVVSNPCFELGFGRVVLAFTHRIHHTVTAPYPTFIRCLRFRNAWGQASAPVLNGTCSDDCNLAILTALVVGSWLIVLMPLLLLFRV